MNSNEQPPPAKGYVRSVDGRRAIPLEEFDRLAEEGSAEIDHFIDWSKARTINPGDEELLVSIPATAASALGKEAERAGLTPESLIERWVVERLDQISARVS